MGSPTKEEFQALRKFREIITDIELAEHDRTDDALLKWLRARELDLDKANDMLRKSLQWRLDNGIADILNWKPPAYLYDEFPYAIYGYTATGCPVLGLHCGVWDFRKIAGDTHIRDVWLKYVDLILAQTGLKIKKYSANMRQESESSKTKVETQYVAVLDVGGFLLRQLTSFSSLSAINALVRRFEANYPELIKSVYVVNASWIFLSIFKLIKPWMTERTLAKIQVFGSNRDEWVPVLLRNIPVDQLGVRYGGTYKENEIIELNLIDEEQENSKN